MKKTLFTIMAAALALSACQKSDQPVNGAEKEEANTITVTALATNGTDTKVTMGAKAGDAYPMSWNNSGERVYLLEVVRDTDPSKTTTADTGSVAFNKIDAHRANFTFQLASQTKETTYDYAAVYPCHPTQFKKGLNHGVRPLANVKDDPAYRVSYILNHTVSQVPAADGPDQSTHIYIAKDMNHSTQATSLNLAFQSVVSYGKMTIKNFPALAGGETVSKIVVTAPDKIMTGRLFHYFKADATHAVDSTVAYSATTVRPYVMIDPQNITFNTTGFDVWFTTLPFDMTTGDKLKLTVETSLKTYQVTLSISKPISFKAGRVSEFTYNYDKASPDKILTFDFSTCPTGWPSGSTEYNSTDHTTKTHPYVLNETPYNFTSAVCLDLAATSTRNIAWGYDGTNTQSYYVAQPDRFFGLPEIAGWKLITVKFTQACTTESGKKVCITSAITNSGKQSTAYVTGGEAQAVKDQGTEYTFNLSGTTAGTRYYWAPKEKGNGFATMTLIYEEVK